MAIVSTGQVTIYDHNDAVSIAAYITASEGLSQTKSVSDAEVAAYTPDYNTGTDNTLTAAVYVGSSNVVALLSNAKWSLNDPAGESIGASTTYAVATNQNPDTASQRTYYFQGDYTDPVTNLVTHILAQITLIAVKTGTNAVFIQVRGSGVIEKASTNTQNTTKVWADLMRGATVDETNIHYKWFKYPYATAGQLDANHTDVTNDYINFVATDDIADGAWEVGDHTTAPTDGAWADVKGIEISEEAVTDIQLYKVKAYDTILSEEVAEAIFQIVDQSDPYEVILTASNGNIFQNAGGPTKTLTPTVFNGGRKVTLDSSYTFDYELIDRFGEKSGFIDTGVTSVPKAISANSAGITGNFTVATMSSAPANGDAVRVISADGTTVRSYEVGTGSTTTKVVIKTPVNGFSAVAPTLNQFVDGTLSVYVNDGADAGKRMAVAYDASCAVTAEDIDGMGQILVTVNRAFV